MAADRYTYDAADLATTITTSGTPALGGYYSYTATVTNNGPITATGVTLTLALSNTPSANIVISSHSKGTCSVSGETLNCAVGSLALNAKATVSILIEPLGTGAITATSTISATQPDTNTANNTESTTAQVTNANGCTLIGTPGADQLTATGDNAVICGLSGNDTIIGGTGTGVTVYVGSGADTVTVGPGNNQTIYGGTGGGTLTTAAGTGNTIYAGDYLYTGAKIGTLHGTHGTTCYATHNDHLYGCATVIYK